MTTAASHARVKALFLAALERAAPERRAFLASATHGDDVLRERVEALLTFHVESDDGGTLSPPVVHRFAPGDLFAGRFRLVTSRGRGAMGEVWQAQDLVVDGPVALKVLHAADAAARAALLNEVRLARQVTHPAVCRVFDVGEHDGAVFLSMELVAGEDLGALLLREGRLPLERAIDVGLQLCDGLAAAHAQGVLHRDLKPANILIDDRGRVRITDFGIAVTQGTPLPRSVAGTPGYMAPEQAAGASTLGAACDLWAFGIVMFELLSGRRAWGATTCGPRENDGSPSLDVDVGRLPPEVPPPLRALLGRCLTTDPTKRLQEASAARGVLERLRASLESARFEHAVLVLPFVNLGPDPHDDYFSDGLTEEVIADLSGIEALRVISRTTAMRFKGVTVDLATVGRELDVRFVLEGSVRKSGANLRITAQLVDTHVDRTLWSERFAGTLDDVFGMQEQVARAIATTLQLRLTVDEDRGLARRRGSSGYVYDLYLKTRRDILSFDRVRLERALRELEQAHALLGDDVLVCAGLGMACWQYVNAGFSTDAALLERAEAYARTVMTLDPAGPHGPAIMAHLAAPRGCILDWVRYGERALAASPCDPDALVWLAMGWTWAGHPEAARPLFARLQAIDPLFDYLYFGLAFLEQCEGHFTQALDLIRRARTLQPDMVAWPLTEVQLLLQLERWDEAAVLADAALPSAGSHPLADMTRALVHACRHEPAAARALLTEDLEARLWPDMQYAHFVAQIHACLGDVERALIWLEQSTRRGFVHLAYLSSRDPLLSRVRDHPGFAAVMQRALTSRASTGCAGGGWEAGAAHA